MGEIAKEQAAMKAARKVAENLREREHADWLVNDKDDHDASEVVANAIDVLSEFYRRTGMMFAQTDKKAHMASGDPPPPPPATWDGGLEVKSGEATGIVAILEMIHEDIKKDSKDAQNDENNAVSEFKEYMKNSAATLKNLQDQYDANSSQGGRAAAKKHNTESARGRAKAHLVNTLNSIKDVNPNCEYFEVNYPMRRSNRQIEVDGLNQAKAILNGGSFDAGPDPNREMNVGDAASALFLQRSNRR